MTSYYNLETLILRKKHMQYPSMKSKKKKINNDGDEGGIFFSGRLMSRINSHTYLKCKSVRQ